MALTKIPSSMLNVVSGNYPPFITSAVVPSDGTTVVLTFNTSTVPLLPVTGITGFTVSGQAVTSAARTSNTQITLTLSTTVYTGINTTVSYTPGNVQDSTPYTLGIINTYTVTNNSAVAAPLVPESGLMTWLIADTAVYTNIAGTTPSTTTGDSVKRWIDQSTAGSSVTGDQTPYISPTLKTGAANGHNSVVFSKVPAADSCLSFASTASGVKDIFVVMKFDLGRAGVYLQTFIATKSGGSHYFGSAAVDNGASATPNYSGILPLNTWFIYCARTTGTQTIVDQNITQIGISSQAAHVQYNCIGGHNFNLSGYCLNGEIAEVVMYSRILTTLERDAVKTYLKDKYALVY